MKREVDKCLNGEFIGRKYNLVVWKTVADYGNRPSPHTIMPETTKRVRNVELMNINGFGMGQVHFVDEAGAYIMYPWCAIVTMEPVEEAFVVEIGDRLVCTQDIEIDNLTFTGVKDRLFIVKEKSEDSYIVVTFSGDVRLALTLESLKKFFKKK